MRSRHCAQYDRVIGRIKDIIRAQSTRPYDSGSSCPIMVNRSATRSCSATAYSLKEFVEQQLARGTQVTVGQTPAVDDGTTALPTGVDGRANCQNVQEQGVAGGGKAIIKQAGKYADRPTTAQLAAGELTAPVSITCAAAAIWGRSILICIRAGSSGMNSIEAYPGLVAALVQPRRHRRGCVADETGVPLALGKRASAICITGQVRGEDPMKMYGDPDHRAAQCGVCRFPARGRHHGAEHGVSRWDRWQPWRNSSAATAAWAASRPIRSCCIPATCQCRQRATRPICLRF